jgi:hypothetical protein
MSQDNATRNAQIEEMYLGIEDHGMFIAQITMDYGDGGHQSYQRILHQDDCHKVLLDILDIVGVRSWEGLKGKSCRVVLRDGFIRQIGNYLDDKWTYDPDTHAKAV